MNFRNSIIKQIKQIKQELNMKKEIRNTVAVALMAVSMNSLAIEPDKTFPYCSDGAKVINLTEWWSKNPFLVVVDNVLRVETRIANNGAYIYFLNKNKYFSTVESVEEIYSMICEPEFVDVEIDVSYLAV